MRGKKDISWADPISHQSPQLWKERMALLGDSLEPVGGLGNRTVIVEAWEASQAQTSAVPEIPE